MRNFQKIRKDGLALLLISGLLRSAHIVRRRGLNRFHSHGNRKNSGSSRTRILLPEHRPIVSPGNPAVPSGRAGQRVAPL